MDQSVSSASVTRSSQVQSSASSLAVERPRVPSLAVSSPSSPTRASAPPVVRSAGTMREADERLYQQAVTVRPPPDIISLQPVRGGT
eukprot:1600295-Rhodomonas_salina.1